MSKTIKEALDKYCEKLTGEKPETRTIRESLNAITEANGGTPSQGGIADAIDCLCECSGGGGAYHVVFSDFMKAFDATVTPLTECIMELIIPEGVTEITNYIVDEEDDEGYEVSVSTFKDWFCLEKISFPSTLPVIPTMILQNHDIIREVIISEGVTKIEQNAFFGCWRMQTVDIPSTVTKIEYNSFYNCNSATITIHKPEGSISGAPWGATGATIIWTG